MAKQQPSDPTPKVIRCRFTSTGDSRVLCAQAQQKLPFQEFVLDPPFLPTLCHRIAMPQDQPADYRTVDAQNAFRRLRELAPPEIRLKPRSVRVDMCGGPREGGSKARRGRGYGCSRLN